ncbi:hypothetical protein ACSD3Z_005545, partial [Escherichia coli]
FIPDIFIFIVRPPYGIKSANGKAEQYLVPGGLRLFCLSRFLIFNRGIKNENKTGLVISVTAMLQY